MCNIAWRQRNIVKEELRKSTTSTTIFIESTLTLVFWLCASMLIMQPIHLYFTDEITQFFNLKIVSREILFISFISAYIFAMFASLFISRVLYHTYVLSLALGFVLIATVLFFTIPSFVSVVIFALGLGLIPASAVCSVVERLDITSSSQEQRKKSVERFSTKRVRPVGMYIMLPVIATLAFIVKSIVGIFFFIVILCVCIVVLLLKHKNFGFFTSVPTLRASIAGTIGNGMFYLVLFILVVVSLIDMSVFYYVPYVVQEYVVDDAKNMTALLFLIMFIGRIAMIMFTELTLIHVPPRRIFLLSACSIGFSMLLLLFAHDAQAKIIVLFVIMSSLSVTFPSLIKSMAKFIPFSVLPTSVISMALIGNMVTMVSYAYFFPYVLRTNRTMLFSSVFVLSFMFAAFLFFIFSRREKLVQADET